MTPSSHEFVEVRVKKWINLRLLAVAIVAAIVLFVLARERRAHAPAAHSDADTPGAMLAQADTVPVAATDAPTEWCEEHNGTCLPKTCAAHERTVVVFHAVWCGVCKDFAREVLADPDVQAKLAPFGRVRVDAEENGRASAEANVRAVPLIQIRGRDCKEITRIKGYMPKDQFMRELDKAQGR